MVREVSSRPLIDHQSEQYRRGQILGFTMAEIMLVLLFLLLLLMGAKLTNLSKLLEDSIAPDSVPYQSVDRLEKTLAKLKESGVVGADKDLLWLAEALSLSAPEVLSQGDDTLDLVKELNEALEENLVLDKALDEASQKLDASEEIISELSTEVTDQAKDLQAATERLDALKDIADMNQELLTEVSQGRKLTSILDDRNISVPEAQQCLLSCGGGPKACWGESISNPDYIYNVGLYDNQLYVTPNLENAEKNKEDWASLPETARISEPMMLSNAQFTSRFDQLLRHANANECVYQVRLIDVATPTKPVYKSQRTLVENYVYISLRKSWNSDEYGDLLTR